ncbi:MAG: 16S rRNA (guanine(527)-N(7))-methyltransferase RsmG [Holosporales bacterium]|jgi:16S rRNA (guanine(527)-N(7))-methyltransferase RsmG|nr:16S rRNA (guanine(527)-N(7))-methyltransferase RsmG [Holosporales bacterium]
MINEYVRILSLWNAKMNLVQYKTLNDVYRRHIADSEQICEFFAPNLDGNIVVDIGSGAGLPGVVLAIKGVHNIILCEKNSKKCVFLAEVKSKLKLNYKIYNGDIYKLAQVKGSKHKIIFVSRAFGSLNKLIDIMYKFNADEGIFHKGESYVDEIKIAEKEFEFHKQIFESAVNNKSVIIKIDNVRKKYGD